MKKYLVGGAVRDLLLGRTPKEFDYAFAGTLEEFIALNPGARQVGRSVSNIICNGLDFTPLKGSDLAADLHKRDFTINAIAMEENGLIHAHPSAFADLAGGVLRPASPVSFAEDPLRVFRAARFLATLPGFSAHKDCLDQMRAAAEKNMLARLPAERVGRELLKAMSGPVPGNFLRLLAEADCLVPWFAELEQARHITAGPAPWHDNSTFEHTCEVIEAVAKRHSQDFTGAEAWGSSLTAKTENIGSLAVWMAMCHDLGKISSPKENLPRHYGHETRGAKLAVIMGWRLALPKKFIKAGTLAARHHMKAGQYFKLRPGTRCDLLMEIHNAGLTIPFWLVVDADSGKEVSVKAFWELEKILRVVLPPEWRDRGKDSAARLRGLRCEALS